MAATASVALLPSLLYGMTAASVNIIVHHSLDGREMHERDYQGAPKS
jgi:hypothetical protein